MPTMGDVREDGYIFRTFFKDKHGQLKEHWLSPEAFKKWSEKRNSCNRLIYSKNIEQERKRNKTYAKNNRHKSNARASKRRASKLKASPIWLTKNQVAEIGEFYNMAKQLETVFPWKQEVDHIEPLQGKDICGLHVPWNLQIIPRVLNRSKGIKRVL